MSKGTLITLLKIVLMIAILAFVGLSVSNTISKMNTTTAGTPIVFHWDYAPIAVLAFAGVMLTSGAVWYWLARHLGNRGKIVPLMGAYCFSQMGKYIPGKVMLLLMRIERAQRFGMDAQTTTVSTLIENAMYMVSGAVTALLTIALVRKGAWEDATHHLALLITGAVVLLAMSVLFHPRILYPIIHLMLRKFQRGGATDVSRQFKTWQMALSVLLFVPCWAFGGIGLWASVRCVAPIGFSQGLILPGAFALSVIVGMASLLPGGAVIREAVQVFFLVPLLSPSMGNNAPAAAAIAVGVQRLCQIGAEVSMGGAGALLTARRRGSVKGMPDAEAPQA